jgi:hypothetical protein
VGEARLPPAATLPSDPTAVPALPCAAPAPSARGAPGALAVATGGVSLPAPPSPSAAAASAPLGDTNLEKAREKRREEAEPSAAALALDGLERSARAALRLREAQLPAAPRAKHEQPLL